MRTSKQDKVDRVFLLQTRVEDEVRFLLLSVIIV